MCSKLAIKTLVNFEHISFSNVSNVDFEQVNVSWDVRPCQTSMVENLAKMFFQTGQNFKMSKIKTLQKYYSKSQHRHQASTL